jgi:hypothetical protein
MGLENKTGLNVNNHYGPRTTGGSKGELPSAGVIKELEFNFDLDGGQLLVNPILQAGDVVVEFVDSFATGTVTATCNSQDITGADGSSSTYIIIGAKAPVLVGGATSGQVIVRYMRSV